MKKFIQLTIVIVFTMLTIAGSAWGADWYVSTTGSDVTGDGTSGNPWATIQFAVSNASVSPGDVVNVAAGTYDITSKILVNKGVTITGPTSGGAIVRGAGTSLATLVVFEITTSNVIIKNLDITLASSTPRNTYGTDAEINTSLISIPTGSGMTGINIKDNNLYVPSQSGSMTTWGHRAITAAAGSVNGISITENHIYNTRNGVVIHYNNTATISNNDIHDTKGGIMNYTSTQADANNRTMSNNTWGTTHNEWDIVWNSGGGPYDPDYNQTVLVLSGANNDAYVLSLMTTGTLSSLTGNRSHIFVNKTTGTTTQHPANGNMNLPYSTIQLGINAVVPGGKVLVAAGTYNEHDITINKSVRLTGDPGDLQPGPGVNAPVVDGQNLWSDAFLIKNGVSNVTIQGFEIKNYTGGTGSGNGNAVQAWVASTSHITIADNYMHDLRWNGVLVGNDGATGDHSYWTIARNILNNYGTGTFSYSGYGMELTNTSHGIIEDNIITAGTRKPGTGILITVRRPSEVDMTIRRNEVSGDFDYCGVLVYAYNGEVSNPNLNGLVIDNNSFDISGPCSYAMYVRDIGGTVTNVSINSNKIIKAGGRGLYSSTAQSINAECNWWGSATLCDIVPLIKGNVDFIPYLTDGTDTETGTPGFQPASGTCGGGGGGGGIVTNLNTGMWYCKIQPAIDDPLTLNGHTIKVYPGLYVEQIEINNKNITLEGSYSASEIRSPATLTKYFTTSEKNYPIIYVHNANNVTITKFYINGDNNGNANYRFCGIGFNNAGGSVKGVSIYNVRDNPFSGAQHGIALYLFNDDAISRSFEVKDFHAMYFQKNGMSIYSSATTPLNLDIFRSEVNGAGPTTITAQNGIQVSGSGCIGNIHGNVVNGIAYSGSSNAAASTILPFNSNVNIYDNILSGGHVGIYNVDGQGKIHNNEISVIKAKGFGYGIAVADPPNIPPSPFDFDIIQNTHKKDDGNTIQVTRTVEIFNNNIYCYEVDNTGTGGIEGWLGYYGYNDIDLLAYNNKISGFEEAFGIWQYTYEPTKYTGVRINFNDIANNTYGIATNVDYLNGGNIDGQYNWWGHCSGPGAIATGSGSQVTENVDYTPWIGNSLGGPVLWLTPILTKRYGDDRLAYAWPSATCNGLEATPPSDSRQPAYDVDKGVIFTSDYSNTGYGNSDMMTIPYNQDITVPITATDKWNPSASPKDLFIAFKTGSSVDEAGNPVYYRDGRQMIYEAGGPLSGYNIYIAEKKLVFGMWNRFESKFTVYDPPTTSIYPLVTDKSYVAHLEYDGTNYYARISAGGTSSAKSAPISFKGFTVDGSDGTGIAGANRTRYHDYSTGETYSDEFDGILGDVLLYNKALSVGETADVYAYLGARYGVGNYTPKMAEGDWKLYEEYDFTSQNAISEAYPNPFVENTSFGVNLLESQYVAVEVLDVYGNVLQNIYKGVLPAGMHDFVIDGTNLSSGMYVFRVMGDNFVQSGKVILSK